MDYKLQAVTLPASDVDKTKAFCSENAGFTLDVDYGPAAGFRVVQLPPGSACSVQLGIGLTGAAPGLNACGAQRHRWRASRVAPRLRRCRDRRRRPERTRGAQTARRRHRTRTFPSIANACALLQNSTAGGVGLTCTKHGGALPGLLLIGQHVTDMVSAGVVASDSRSLKTVADGVAPHPTLSEAIKGAALVALGRAIDPRNGNLEK